MTHMQYAIARAARQVANRINAGAILAPHEQSNAVATLEALVEQLSALTPGEHAAVLPSMRPIFDAQDTVWTWRNSL